MRYLWLSLSAEKGKTFSFGDNSEGQLGIRLDSKLEGQTKFSFAIRARIPTDSKPLHIACGDYHTALVTGMGEKHNATLGTLRNDDVG